MMKKNLLNKVPANLIIEILDDRFGISIFDLKNVEKWKDLNLDELDMVEIIMEIEKRLDISISDDEWEEFFSQESLLSKTLLEKHREEQINKITNG
jgi:acyl carrier protein